MSASSSERNPGAATPSWAERWVRFLDDGVAIPGTSIRFGADAVLGMFVPVLGDAASAVMSASLFALALERKVPKVVLARMLVNVCLDTLFGSVPIAGDFFDVIFKSNRKNLILIQRHTSPTTPEPPSRRAQLGSYLIVAAAGLALLASVIVPVLLFWWVIKQV